MNQVSRPMQIAVVATLLFAAVWFLVLNKPKTDVAATPVTVPTASVATSTPGKTGSALDQTAYSQLAPAKAAAAAASADAHKQESQTGESGHEDPVASTPATASSAAGSASSASVTKSSAAGATATASAATKAAAPAATAKKSAAASTTSSSAVASTTPKLSHADRVILKVKADLAAQKAVVILVWQKGRPEDDALYKQVKTGIDLRHGKVKTFFIPVNEVGRYDGLLSGLALGQTPSTIVIAPNNQAQVLGGVTSIARIDRLTSAAILTKPTAQTK